VLYFSNDRYTGLATLAFAITENERNHVRINVHDASTFVSRAQETTAGQLRRVSSSMYIIDVKLG
jgi:hypothetical protein